MTIYFYSTKDAYGEFSNFAAFPFDLEGRRWRTSEHYFQAQKFTDEAYQEKIRLTASPMVAARLGRSHKVPIRPDWESVKDDVMRIAVRAKIAAYPELRKLLLGTGDEELVEKTTKDHYWGCGTSGTGKNMLGVILMEVRTTLQTQDT
jgi:ribA/ribD-fused uncharacterized protein